jgi:hypothetical protein
MTLTDTSISLKAAFLHWDAVQGRSEERTEVYLNTLKEYRSF